MEFEAESRWSSGVLVRAWDVNAGAGQTCDGQAVPAGFEGMHVFDISDSGARTPTGIVFVGDLIASPAQVYLPGARLRIDDDPERAIVARTKVIEQALAENAVLATGHARAPYLFEVVDDGSGFAVRWLVDFARS